MLRAGIRRARDGIRALRRRNPLRRAVTLEIAGIVCLVAAAGLAFGPAAALALAGVALLFVAQGVDA